MATLERRLDDLLVELRLTRELLREQRAGEAAQDARIDAIETVVDDLQQQIPDRRLCDPYSGA